MSEKASRGGERRRRVQKNKNKNKHTNTKQITGNERRSSQHGRWWEGEQRQMGSDNEIRTGYTRAVNSSIFHIF